ncbi:MAG: LysR substrate-binding domain-containing protein [Alkalilacustris sp.]
MLDAAAMHPRLPPLNPLRSFEAVARLRSFKRAAEELHVTQGAVSHQVRALEDALGQILLHRLGNRVALTPAGAALLPATSTAFDGIRGAMETIGGVRREGELTVSCVPGFLSGWLLPNLGQFLAKHPEIRLTVLPSNDVAGPVGVPPEVMIRYGSGRWPDRWVSFLSHVDLFPVCSPDLLASRPLAAVTDLANHCLLHAGSRLEWNNWLTAHDALDLAPERGHSFGDAMLATRAAARGLGVALGDRISVGALLDSGRLTAPLPLSARAVHDFYVTCRSEVLALPQVSAFLDWLHAEVPRTLRGDRGTGGPPGTPRGAAATAAESPGSDGGPRRAAVPAGGDAPAS